MNSKKKILLADDDNDDRMLFQSAYKNRQDIILMPIALSGAEVIERLESTSDRRELPDLIILDQNMPMMTGKQTLSWLKSHQRFAKIPVCICSTYADHQLTIDCLKLGAYRVSSKPITSEEYDKMMNDFLDYFRKKDSYINHT